MIGPRHTTIDSDPTVAAEQNAENARDTLDALSTKVAGSLVTISSYTANGSTTTKIPLVATAAAPSAVVLVRAFAVSDPGADCGASPRANFYYDGSSYALNVYEPSGLTAGVVYALTFLIVE